MRCFLSCYLFLLHSGDQAADGIAQAVQSLAPFGSHMRVDGLELLREGVEQAPDGAGPEFLMKRLPPVPDDFRQNGRRDGPAVDRPDQKIMSRLVGQSLSFVDGDPFVFAVELLSQPSDGAGGHEAQIPHGEPRMLPGEFHFSGEGKVVADEDARSHDQRGREGLVIGIAYADNPRVVAGAIVRTQDLENSEIPLSFMAEGMGGFPDPEAVGGELGFHFLQKEVVRNREPRFRTGRGFHTGQGSPVDDFGPAMEEKPFTAYGRRNYRSSCRFRHDISPLEEGCLSGIFQRQDIPGCRRTMRQCDDRMHINDECELKRKHPLPCEWETGVEE